MLTEQMIHWDPKQRLAKITLDPVNHHHLTLAALEQLWANSRYRVLQPQRQAWEEALTQLAKNHELTPIDVVFAQALDGSWALNLSKDKMTLTATLTFAQGGEAATVSQLLQLLKNGNLTQGLCRSAILAMIDQQRDHQHESATAVIAFGKPAVPGHNGYLKRLVPLPSEHQAVPQAIDIHRVDMRNLGQTFTVDRGHPLLQRIAPTLGQPGYTILGETLDATDGEPAQLIAGSGTYIDSQNPDLLIAEISGIPLMQDHGMAIEPQLTVAGVSVLTGHLKFNGSIVITGDVEDGMQVHATGNIHIQGSVHNAIIDAGGDLSVDKGVVGHQQDNGHLQCQIRAGGNVTIHYAQFAHIDCVGDLEIRWHAVNCNLRTAQMLYVGLHPHKQGGLNGGSAYARLGLQCNELGTKTGVETRVVVGADYQSLLDTATELENQQQELSRNWLAEQVKLNNGLKAGEITAEAKEQALQLIAYLKTLSSENEQQLQQQQELIEHFSQERQILITKYLLPRVNITLGNNKYFNNEAQGASQLVLEQGKLVRQPLTASPKKP
ncbi:MAG: FapA family protein [Ferrimonas sp.]